MSYLPIYLSSGLTLSEKVALSGEIFLRGMGTVFMVLILLWGILSLFKVFSTGTSEKKVEKKTETVAEQTPAPTVDVNEAENTVTAQAQADDTAVIAAICAAIEAYRESEGFGGLPYRVVSFKRKSGRKSRGSENDD